jgi:hypothetical protein
MHHVSGVMILISFIALCCAVILLVLHLTRIGKIVHQRLPDRPHRRLFLASISFFITFVSVRLLVMCIRHNVGPFGYVEMGGHHIHHLVWGIWLLLLSGYGTMAEWGTRGTPMSILASRILALMYGVGAALTLDEFALWLSLDPQAYWSHEGRWSIDAVILFGALLAMGTWGSPMFRRLTRREQKMAKIEEVKEKAASEVETKS